MAKMLMCAVRDHKVGAFSAPFVSRSRGEAIRSFGEAAQAKDSMLFKHPGDYELFSLGTWDDVTGFFDGGGLEPLCGASDFVITLSKVEVTT